MSQGPPAGSVLQRSVATPGNQPQSPEDDDRKVRRREKNRVAAQRSRKKQTQKADKLHEEYECLEQENTVLRREISKLKEELRHLSEALREHEKMCPLLCPLNFVQVRPDPVASCLPR
ncbi:Basic leucine zipper transcriptional factor ATF-like 3 [Lemmus lemmus]